MSFLICCVTQLMFCGIPCPLLYTIHVLFTAKSLATIGSSLSFKDGPSPAVGHSHWHCHCFPPGTGPQNPASCCVPTSENDAAAYAYRCKPSTEILHSWTRSIAMLCSLRLLVPHRSGWVHQPPGRGLYQTVCLQRNAGHQSTTCSFWFDCQICYDIRINDNNFMSLQYLYYLYWYYVTPLSLLSVGRICLIYLHMYG